VTKFVTYQRIGRRALKWVSDFGLKPSGWDFGDAQTVSRSRDRHPAGRPESPLTGSRNRDT